MFKPCRITTRPRASGIPRPAGPSGGFGAAAAGGAGPAKGGSRGGRRGRRRGGGGARGGQAGAPGGECEGPPPAEIDRRAPDRARHVTTNVTAVLSLTGNATRTFTTPARFALALAEATLMPAIFTV